MTPTSIARTLLADKREDEALDRFELSSERATDRAVRVSASAHIAALLLGFRRPWEVAEFTGRMRRDRGDDALAALLDASACVQLGDAVGALQLAGESGPVATPCDPWFPCTQSALWAVRIRALHEAGRDVDAIAELQVALAAAPLASPLWEVTATLVAAGALAADEVIDHLDPGAIAAMFGWIAGAPVEGIDALAEALWARRPANPAVLAAATLFVWRLAADGALGGACDSWRPAHRRAHPCTNAPSAPACLLSIGWRRQWSRRRSTPTGREPRSRVPCRCSPTTI